MRELSAWGNYVHVTPAAVLSPRSRQDELPIAPAGKLLAFGRGRSYGDVCLNGGGTSLVTSRLDHFIAFDSAVGRLTCESGVTLAEILALIVPQGWFLPVTPGTQFVTMGGAIANDVHGKNHHAVGTFGCHLRGFELLRSDGSRYYCSATSNRQLFSATIGGLGLTGLITWAEIALKRISSPELQMENIPFANIDEFLRLSSESTGFDHTVAWVDCLSRNKGQGRGHFFRANHVEHQGPAPKAGARFALGRAARRFSVPFHAPEFALNRFTISAFNAAYYHVKRRGSSRVGYRDFFYPLDAIAGWNRLYGRRGFLQHQCVIPVEAARATLARLLQVISESGQGSFLSVLKVFGEIKSPGMLSFPRAGVTLALDFPMRGESTLKLLAALDVIVVDAQGAIYPAKDARMSGNVFEHSFPRLAEFEKHIDPGFSSTFWRRVRGSELKQESA